MFRHEEKMGNAQRTDDRQGACNNVLVLVIPTFLGGGAERVFSLLAYEWARAGYEVRVLLKDAKGENLKEIQGKVEIISGEGSWFRLFRRVLLNRSLRDAKAVLSTLDAANGISALLKLFGAYGNQTRWVARQAGLVKDRSNCRGQVLKWVRRVAWDLCDAIIVNSCATARSIENTDGVAQKKIVVIGNPFQMRDTQKSFSQTRRREHGTRSFSLVAVGRLVEKKRMECTIEAVDVLRKRGKAVYLDIYGEGPERARLEGLVQSKDMERHVKFRGYDPKVRDVLHEYDVLVHTADFEGFGNVIVEAMAAGIQVVAGANSGAPAEILEGGRFGQLFPSSVPDEVADAIWRAYRNPVSIKDLIGRADEFSVEKISKRYLAFLLEENNQ